MNENGCKQNDGFLLFSPIMNFVGKAICIVIHFQCGALRAKIINDQTAQDFI